MPPVEVTADYYAVLEMSKNATPELITKSYRRLARIRHPDKNPSSTTATAEFQLLQNAYDTISDPAKRRAYDTRWAGIRDSLRAQQESEKRQAEATETERNRATEERAKQQKEDDARQERLRSLRLLKSRLDSESFELSRVVRTLTADLKRFQDQDEEDVRKEVDRNSLQAYLTSPPYGKVQETGEQKQTRETERLHRLASRRIKESELHQKEAKLQGLQSALQTVDSQIAAEKEKAADETLAQARERILRMEQEARSRVQQEMRERFAKAQKEQAERAAKEAREAQAAREAREAREAEECVRQAEAAQRRKTEEAARKARKAQNERFKPATPLDGSSRSSGSTKTTCRHYGFWPKIEGRHLCSNCHTFQRRFALRCPGCSMIACASCRHTFRGEGRKTHNAGWRYGADTDDNYDDGFSYYDFD